MFGIVLIYMSTALDCSIKIDSFVNDIFSIMADKNVLILRILTHVVEECYYERMLGEKCKGIDAAATYNEFFLWNKECLEELSYEDVNWVWGLCNRLNRRQIGTMDMEDCGIWKADTIFYDTYKRLIIVHPR